MIHIGPSSALPQSCTVEKGELNNAPRPSPQEVCWPNEHPESLNKTRSGCPDRLLDGPLFEQPQTSRGMQHDDHARTDLEMPRGYFHEDLLQSWQLRRNGQETAPNTFANRSRFGAVEMPSASPIGARRRQNIVKCQGKNWSRRQVAGAANGGVDFLAREVGGKARTRMSKSEWEDGSRRRTNKRGRCRL
ncbi:hypothetical protein BV25DRAFT_1508404 [Artomyces pyxidatus]|uniref:Uncharacterized protein n=1 Tax=Artomyces pyxidatus TaxID=48021 RepID=A0ACB8TD44_9AGAM|nr:hypothetical protein BV25DRAFT_1508404 [Artomyces pyxidatus]